MPATGLNQEYQGIIDDLCKEIEVLKVMREIAIDEIAKLQGAKARLTQSLKAPSELHDLLERVAEHCRVIHKDYRFECDTDGDWTAQWTVTRYSSEDDQEKESPCFGSLGSTLQWVLDNFEVAQ